MCAWFHLSLSLLPLFLGGMSGNNSLAEALGFGILYSLHACQFCRNLLSITLMPQDKGTSLLSSANAAEVLSTDAPGGNQAPGLEQTGQAEGAQPPSWASPPCSSSTGGQILPPCLGTSTVLAADTAGRQSSQNPFQPQLWSIIPGTACS